MCWANLTLGVPWVAYLPHKVSRTLTKLPCPTFARSKGCSHLGQGMTATRSPRPKTDGPCRHFSIDKLIGHQAQVEDLIQFMDLDGLICPKLRLVVESCQCLKIAIHGLTYLTNTFATPCTKGEVDHLGLCGPPNVLAHPPAILSPG